MNILPAPPPRSDRPAPGRPSDAGSTGFAQLLAGHVDDGTPTGVVAVATRPAVDEGAGADHAGEGGGAVAAAVHAAIAAWRADPTDVALGSHLRQVLREVVADHAGAVPAVPGVGTVAAAPDGDGEVGGDPATAGGPATTPTSAPAPAPSAPPPVAGVPTGSRVVVATVPGAPTAAPPAPTGPAPTTAPVGVTATDGPATTAPPAPRAAPAVPPRRPGAPAHSERAAAEVTEAGPELVDAAPTRPTTDAPAPSAARPVTAAATLERVLQAVEALEHAPPPRRLAVEVEGVQLTVALRGEDVQVLVRGGADQLPAGWQRELASALRGRGLDLAGHGATAGGDGRGGATRDDRGQPRTPADPRPATRRPDEADAGLRL